MNAVLGMIGDALLVIGVAAGLVWCIDCWVFFDGVPGMFW